MKIKIKKTIKYAKIPTYAHDNDAGMDLYAAESHTMYPGVNVIRTGIAMEIPEGYVGLVMDKSGIASKYGFSVIGGVIDSGYKGEIMVVLYKSEVPFVIPHTFLVGDKVAQMLIQKVERAEFEEVEELGETQRGDKGFGSTGR